MAITPAERAAARYKTLRLIDACETCSVTGGGAGNGTACGDAKFGFVARDDEGGNDSGRLNFSFGKEFHINGPVTVVRCLEIGEGEDGDTYGTVQFAGDVKVDKGISADTFIVTVQDFGEPNKNDALRIEIFDSAGNQIFFYQCETEDGNIQLHPTRFAQTQ